MTSLRRAAVAAVVLWLVVGVLAPAAAHVGDPEDYRWVVPPPEVADTNEAPGARSAALVRSLGPTAIWTPDLQATLLFDEQPYPDVDTVWVELSPLDPASLPTLPNQLTPVGNAYAIAITDDEGGDPLGPDASAVVQLTVPHPTDVILHLDADGNWVEGVAAENRFGFTTEFVGSTTYLAAAVHESSGVDGTLILAGWAAAVAVGGGLLLRSRRRRD